MATSLDKYKEKIRLLETSYSGINNNFRFFLKKVMKYSDSSIILNDNFDILDHEVCRHPIVGDRESQDQTQH